MSKELADRFERDLSADKETAERARQARTRSAALDVDWKEAFEMYAAHANQDPKRFIRVPVLNLTRTMLSSRGVGDMWLGDDER